MPSSGDPTASTVSDHRSSDSVDPHQPKSSLAKSSAAVAVADVGLLVSGLVTAAVTARWLGPAGKGALSALLLIGHGFLFYALTAGMGDAAIFSIRNRGEPVQRVVSSTLPVLAVTSIVGAGILTVISIVAEWSGIATAVIATAVGLAGWILFEFLAGVLNSQEKIPLTSLARAAVSFGSMLATVIFVGPLHMDVLGGAAGVLIGVGAGLVWLSVELRRSGISLRPRWDQAYVRAALRYGIPSQGSIFLLALSQRSDQLVVYSLRGEAEGGLYSVALTLGWLITYVPGALVRAAFPRMSGYTYDQATDLLGQMIRVNVLAALVAGAGMALLLPFVVPWVFGEAYRASVTPATLLLVAGFLWTLQWTLSRSAAARGRPGLPFVAVGGNLLVMLALNVLLVPGWGMPGAALAAIGGAFSGLILSLMMGAGRGLRWQRVLPTRADFGLVAISLRTMFTRRPRG